LKTASRHARSRVGKMLWRSVCQLTHIEPVLAIQSVATRPPTQHAPNTSSRGFFCKRFRHPQAGCSQRDGRRPRMPVVCAVACHCSHARVYLCLTSAHCPVYWTHTKLSIPFHSPRSLWSGLRNNVLGASL
jgi:hypothetical protein